MKFVPFVLLFMACLSMQAAADRESQIDSLRALLPALSGEAKLNVLNDLCYLSSFEDLPSSIAFGEQAVQLARSLEVPALLAQACNDLSIAYNNRGDFERSLVLNDEALRIRESLGDSLAVVASLSKIATAYQELGRLDESLQANLRALRIAENEGVDAYVGLLLNNIGTTYERNFDYAAAMEMRLRAVDLGRKVGDSLAVFTAEGNVANLLEATDRLDESRALYFSLMERIPQTPHTELLAVCYQGLGVVERKEGDIRAGIRWYRKALESYRASGLISGEAVILMNLGNCYVDLNQPDSAEYYAQRAIPLMREMNSFTNLYQVHKTMRRVAELQGELSRAFAHEDSSDLYRDSLYSQSGNQLLQEYRVQYQTAKKERELAVSEAEVQRRKLQTARAVVALILTLGVGGVVVASARQRRKRMEQDFRHKQALQRAASEQQIAQEKLRISRELHDNIGAQITFMVSSIDNLGFKEGDAERKSRLERLSAFGRDAMQDLRHAVWAMKSENGTIGDLASKIREQMADLVEGTRCSVEANKLESQPLNAAQMLNVFRIAQEAIQNALKHAQAKHIEVVFQKHQASISMHVTDDGQGFDPDAVAPGNGLTNMSTRASAIGGTVGFRSVPGGGTTVYVTWKNTASDPLESDA